MRLRKIAAALCTVVALLFFFAAVAHAEPFTIPQVEFSVRPAETGEEAANSIQVLLMLTVLALAPSILIMTTAFTRIIIVLSFTRSAVGVQQAPPNQVLIGLALFLTFFVMSPVITDIYDTAYKPLIAGEITNEQATENAIRPLKEFMVRQIYSKDMNLFLSLSKAPKPEKPEDLPLSAVIPAFITSEIKRAFQIGFLIYIPFLIIDMVVSSTLMTMGMMMLPPMMISLPFKILLFVLVDGWGLIIKTLIEGFK